MMNKIIEITYFCDKCNRNLRENLPLEIPTDSFDDELKRVQEYFLNIHKRREHTTCASCGKKIRVGIDPKKSWGVQVVGKSYEKPNSAGDTGMRIYTAIFCKDCIRKIEKERSVKKGGES